MNNERLRYFFLLFLLNLFLNNKAESQRRIDSIERMKQIIQSNNVVSTSGVGEVGAPSKYWYAFGYILFLSTNEELEKMTYAKSPALRIYAYIGLYHNKYSNLKKVKQRLSGDNETASSIQGCVGDETTVAKGIKSIKNWYYENTLKSFLIALKNNTLYRHELFNDLISGKKIKKWPDE